MAEIDRFQRYVDHKLDMARRLGSGECGGDYSDACVLISALLSGIAADLFPGTGMDRRRFVETWVRYGRPDFRSSSISVPLLIRRLRRKGRHSEAAAVEKLRSDSFGPGHATRVLIGSDVDLPEDAVLQASPKLTRKDVRDRSYPVVFYEHVRSTLVHEFHLDNRASSVPMTNQETAVSYVNVLHNGAVQRRIHFHLPWLLDLARSVADGAKEDVQKRPMPLPSAWWIDGK